MITSDLYVVPILLRGTVSADPDSRSQAKPHKGTPFEDRLHDRECGERRGQHLRSGRSCPPMVRQATQTYQSLADGQVARDGSITECNYVTWLSRLHYLRPTGNHQLLRCSASLSTCISAVESPMIMTVARHYRASYPAASESNACEIADLPMREATTLRQ